MNQSTIDKAWAEVKSLNAQIRSGDFLPLGLGWRDRTEVSEILRSFTDDLAYWVGAMRSCLRRNDTDFFAAAHDHYVEARRDLSNYVNSLDGLAKVGW